MYFVEERITNFSNKPSIDIIAKNYFPLLSEPNIKQGSKKKISSLMSSFVLFGYQVRHSGMSRFSSNTKINRVVHQFRRWGNYVIDEKGPILMPALTDQLQQYKIFQRWRVYSTTWIPYVFNQLDNHG